MRLNENLTCHATPRHGHDPTPKHPSSPPRPAGFLPRHANCENEKTANACISCPTQIVPISPLPSAIPVLDVPFSQLASPTPPAASGVRKQPSRTTYLPHTQLPHSYDKKTFHLSTLKAPSVTELASGRAVQCHWCGKEILLARKRGEIEKGQGAGIERRYARGKDDREALR